MGDYLMPNLNESKNECCIRLNNILTPAIIQGIKSIYDESCQLCVTNKEPDKYLMTFQTFLTRIPKWNNVIIENERKRIIESCGIKYLEDLITCVHIIQLKMLSCIRVGQSHKKIDINIPSIDTFIHKVYINAARKIYTNVYLFEQKIQPLQIQKHNREIELIIKEVIMDSVRESIPMETILRAYMSETEEIVEQPIKEEIGLEENNEENVSEPDKLVCALDPANASVNPIAIEPISTTQFGGAVTDTNVSDSTITSSKLTFSDKDNAIDINGVRTIIEAPKTIERLEEISKRQAIDAVEDDISDKLKIGGDSVDISHMITEIN